MELPDLSQGCSNKSDTVVINKNVTRLTTQGCNNTAISIMTVSDLLEQPCNKPDNINKVVNSLFQTCWQLVTSSAQTTCWRLVDRLVTRCEIFACVNMRTSRDRDMHVSCGIHVGVNFAEFNQNHPIQRIMTCNSTPRAWIIALFNFEYKETLL
jgi:hypothetical protein